MQHVAAASYLFSNIINMLPVAFLPKMPGWVLFTKALLLRPNGEFCDDELAWQLTESLRKIEPISETKINMLTVLFPNEH